MQGQLQEIDVCSLLQIIELGQRTGLLHIEAKGTAWSLSFARGRIIHASPIGTCQERLQDFLHRLHPNLGDRLQLPGEQAEYRILCHLLQTQLLSRKQSQVLIQRLVEETLFDVLPIHQGSFKLQNQPFTKDLQQLLLPEQALSPEQVFMPIAPSTQPIPVKPCVARVSHQLKGWNQLYPVVEHPEQCLSLRDPTQLSRQVEGSAFKQLARWADGSLSLRQLSRRLNRSMTAVAQAIYPFIETKTIQLLSQPSISNDATR